MQILGAPALLQVINHTEKKTLAVEAVTGYIDVPSFFQVQRPKTPGVAPEAIQGTTLAPGTSSL